MITTQFLAGGVLYRLYEYQHSLPVLDIFTLSDQFLYAIEDTIPSIVENIVRSFPRFCDIENASNDGPVIKLARVTLRQAKVDLKDVPVFIEKTFFNSEHIIPKSYANAFSDGRSYVIYFRFFKPIEGEIGPQMTIRFNPQVDRIFIVSQDRLKV